MGAYKRFIMDFLDEANSRGDVIVAYISKVEYVVVLPNIDDPDPCGARFIQIDVGFLKEYPNLYEKSQSIE